MTSSDAKFQLPGKVERYLATLNSIYKQKGNALLQKIVVNGVASIHEEWTYDYWNGGTYGHAITFTIPEDIYVGVMEKKEAFQQRIKADLNNLDNAQNEHIAAVFIEMEPTENDRWREESGVYRPRLAASSIPAKTLQRIWGSNHVRIFLSHKSSIKQEVSKLKQSLAQCGVAVFVAHEDIEPTEEWHREIENALFSMDALVALLTDDYHDSNWTDQEVGVAMGRGVPMIPIRLGLDPYGLMGKGQGLGGCKLSNTDDMAIKVFNLLYKRLSDKSRLFECALSAYKASDAWEKSGWKVSSLLSVFESLTKEQVDRVIAAYQGNPQNLSSFAGTKALKPLLEKWTGRPWEVRNNKLVLPKRAEPAEEDVPS
ncbi:MAG: toll/interleukin-1 receptor domain-containing protein [Nitrospinae bacterium]|nr:toll/interleukin-1 receptor domain-containing protein [Nitrospinota bacterium]